MVRAGRPTQTLTNLATWAKEKSLGVQKNIFLCTKEPTFGRCGKPNDVLIGHQMRQAAPKNVSGFPDVSFSATLLKTNIRTAIQTKGEISEAWLFRRSHGACRLSSSQVLSAGPDSGSDRNFIYVAAY